MESPHSVSSPRRILSLSKQRRASVSFLDSHDKTAGFGLSGEHGLKPSEVYGFVGSITTVVTSVVILVWAYLLESWLHSIGISYYPRRSLTRAMVETINYIGVVPTYVMLTILLVLGFSIGPNFMSTPSPASMNTPFNDFNRDPLILDPSVGEDEKPTDLISDIGIDRINDIMFNGAT